jgi:TRAP-type C4-dicarboxylate transport system substrate-binding protein
MKMQTTKLTMALLLGALIGVVSPVYATDIKIATIAPNQSTWMIDMRAAGKTIKERTDGRVNLKFYGGGVQGASPKVMQKIKIGQLHGGMFSPVDFTKLYSNINIYGLPLAFESWEEMRYVRGQMDADLAAGFEKLNYVTFGFVGSFAMILSNEPVRNQADMRGKKVWLPEGDQITFEALKKLNLSPVSLPVTDVLTGLQTGLLDMAAIPPEIAVALQWHTRVKYFTNMPLLYAMSFLAIDKRTMGRLSADDQAVMMEVLSETYANMDAQSSIESLDATEALVDIGIKEVDPDEGELDDLLATMSETNLAMAKKGMLSLALYETMQGHITDYRNGNPQTEVGALSGN